MTDLSPLKIFPRELYHLLAQAVTEGDTYRKLSCGINHLAVKNRRD